MNKTLSIGGFEPLSTQDYPGKISSVIFCNGCTWNCSYCHNDSIRNEQKSLRWNEIYTFLKKRKNFIESVVFSGGEPLIQTSSLKNAINEVRELDLSIGLHTNGNYPKELQEILPLVDWVGLDIKGFIDDYIQITGCCISSGYRVFESLDIILNSSVNYEIRTTPCENFDSVAYLQNLMSLLHEKGVKKYVIQNRRDSKNHAETNFQIENFEPKIEEFFIR